MGPENYELIKEALESNEAMKTGLLNSSVSLEPTNADQEGGVEFVTVRKPNNLAPAHILNALGKYVQFEGRNAGPSRSRHDTVVLLRPVNMSPDGITFQDLHYPNSD